jgi:hypothetical protein
MRKLLTQLSLFIVLFTGMSASTPSINFLDGRHNNVCKALTNDILLYFVFIDTRTTSPWTESDILSTIDSIHTTVRWLKQEADDYGIPLKIKTDYYIGNEYTTIQRNLPRSSVKEVLNDMNLIEGMHSLSKWGDYIAKIIGESLYIKEKDGLPAQKAPATRERLIAFLRDEYQVESVALLMFVNNYYRSDISLAINTLEHEDVEFAVVSYKYPSEIAHCILQLFGAPDLYETHFRRNRRNINLALREFPNDIMSDVYARPLNGLEIGEYTRYMIGWTDDLDGRYEPLMEERFTLFK